MAVCGEFCTICTILKGLLVVAQVCSLEKCRFVSAEGHFVFWPSDKRFEGTCNVGQRHSIRVRCLTCRTNKLLKD